MREFTASNGITVHRLVSGVGFTTPDTGVSRFGINESKVVALREFFRWESTPWRLAKNGEIWALSGADGTVGQWLAEDGRFFRLPLLIPADPEWHPASFASEFTHGRRIWPHTSEES